MTRSVHRTGAIDALQMQKLRDQTSAIRELGDTERTLLDEFASALAQLNR